MSDEKPTQPDQSSQSTATPNTQQPAVATPPQQTNNPPPPKEDPFALNPRLISEIQKGGKSPEQTAIQKPEIIRRAPLEKKQS